MTSIGAITSISETELKRILIDFNDTAADYPRDKCVHTLFEEQAARTPDKTAVIACDRTLTYAELNEQANRIAHGLIDVGIGVGDIVAIILPRSSVLLSAMFGVLKTGAAYMPIDPAYPEERVSFLLRESKAKRCIDERFVDSVTSENRFNPGVSVSSDDAFCALHTSGSTGQPKLSLLRHRGVVNFMFANRRYWENIDTAVTTTIVTFDAFQQDTVLSLAQGIKVVLSDEDEIYNQARFERLFSHSDRNMFFSTPTKMEHYIDSSIDPSYLQHIKSLVLGGEVFSETLLEKIKACAPEVRVFNEYGPTETTICVTVDEVEPDKRITIGKPIANTQIYILDKYLHPTPIGVTGELCVAGDGVGAGYLNRPELTVEKFIDNPFGEGKFYKTGDLAYWREDGNIVYVGRNDFQVKIRGLRIELGEIENAIASIRGIQQAVVVVRKDGAGRQLICAFYTGEKLAAKEIRRIIGQSLPKYMLPHIFTHLDRLPLTTSGKVNRNALPEVDLSQQADAAEYAAPMGELEALVAAAMEKILDYAPVGRDDDFFDLGGDSLKAIELIAALEDDGYRADVKAVFQNGTVRSLAEKLIPVAGSTVIPLEDIPTELPATPAQMRVYTAQAMLGGTAYNVPFAFRAESVDPTRLEKAVQAMVARHEAFRTRFEDRAGTVFQIVEPEAHAVIEQLESDDVSAFIRPFDLSKAPLLRVGYYKNTVMVDMHHIITDGSSMPVFFRELNELYMGRELKNDPVQYGEFAVTPVDTADDERYWLSVFNDELPVLEMNTDFPRTDKQSFSGAAEYGVISGELHNKIKEKCKALNITPYVFYMAAFSVLLSKFSNNEDIVIGMPVSGRSPKFLNTVGMFVNTVALRTKPDGEKSVESFLQEVKELSVSAIDHQNYPFGNLVKKIHAEMPGRNPLFDVMFAYQSEEMTDIVFGDERAKLLPVPTTVSKCDFTFNLMPREADAVLMVEYCTDLYQQQTIRRMIDSYQHILSQML